jgi:hypothetical protein
LRCSGITCTSPADDDRALELEVEAVEMLRHHLHFSRAGDGIMIGEIEDREKIELLDHLDSSVAPRGLDMLPERITITHRCGPRHGCTQRDLLECRRPLEKLRLLRCPCDSLRRALHAALPSAQKTDHIGERRVDLSRIAGRLDISEDERIEIENTVADKDAGTIEAGARAPVPWL